MFLALKNKHSRNIQHFHGDNVKRLNQLKTVLIRTVVVQTNWKANLQQVPLVDGSATINYVRG